MVFNATFNNISAKSWWSILLVEETRVPGENRIPVAKHWPTLSHNIVSSTPRMTVVRTHNVSGAYQSEIYIIIQIPKQSRMRWCYVISVIFYLITKVPSWSWSHGSWIYNYLCNQCLSPLTLCVRTPVMRGVLDAILCEWAAIKSVQ
jgi:hypothetical protein